MGIDIYARWEGQTADEESRRNSRWLQVDAGNEGYLREAYHGEPYVTTYLFAEAFETGEARIPATVLRERLPRALELAADREKRLYGGKDTDAVLRSYREFVSLCEEKERATGQPVLIIATY